MALIASLVKDKIARYYLDIPQEQRRLLERVLLNLRDEDAARASFSEIVNNAPDISEDLRTFLRLGNKLGDYKGSIFYNYGISAQPIEQIDLLCACSPEHRRLWENRLGEFEVPAKAKDVALCCVPGCDYTEKGLVIPIARTSVFLPDEDLWDEEEIVPELTIVFPEKGSLFRRYINHDRFWSVVNTCQAHSSKEDLEKCLEHKRTWEKEHVKHLFSDLIYDSLTLKNPPGISIDEEVYMLEEE